MFNFTVSTQAAMMGLNDIFFASAVIFLAIIPLIWITKRARGGGGGGAPLEHIRGAGARVGLAWVCAPTTPLLKTSIQNPPASARPYP